MAINPQDLAPFIQQASNLPSYSAGTTLPTSGGVPSGGNQYNIPGASTLAPGFANTFGNFASKIPIYGDLFQGLFGKKKPKWQPYLNEQGQYVWANPKQQNPVPRANVPGAPLSPSKRYKKTAADTQALVDLFPYLTQAVNSGVVPTALQELQASQLTSPAYAQLMTDLFNQYGPQLNAIGNEIQRRNALAEAQTQNEVLTGPGKDLVQNAYNLSQVYDQPYYQGRQLDLDNLTKLFNSIDLSGGLSPTERDEISKGLAREGQQRGTLNAPSSSDTVANAMRYGQAGYQRQQQAKSNLQQAINSATAFLPTAKSGVDVFQVATGRPSQANPGQSLFPGINQTGQNVQSAYGLAGGVLGNMNALDITGMNIEANKKDWLDKFNQFTSGLSNLTSSVGGIAGGLL